MSVLAIGEAIVKGSPRGRVRNSNGVGVEGVTVTIEVVAATGLELEGIFTDTLDCTPAFRGNQTAISHFRLRDLCIPSIYNFTGVTGAGGLVTFPGLLVTVAVPGTYTLRMAVRGSSEPRLRKEWSCALTATRLKPSLLLPHQFDPSTQMKIGEPIPVQMIALLSDGLGGLRGVPGLTVRPFSYLASVASDPTRSYVYTPEWNDAVVAEIGGSVKEAVTDSDGIAHFPDLVVTGATSRYVYVSFMTMGVTGTLTSNFLPFYYSTNVSSVTIASDKIAREVDELGNLGSVEILVRNAAGAPVAGKRVFAEPTVLAGYPLPSIWRSPFPPLAKTFKSLLRGWSEATTDARGIAVLGNMTWSVEGLSTGGFALRFVVDGVSTALPSPPITVRTSVKRVIVQWDPPERAGLGQVLGQDPVIVAVNAAGLGVPVKPGGVGIFTNDSSVSLPVIVSTSQDDIVSVTDEQGRLSFREVSVVGVVPPQGLSVQLVFSVDGVFSAPTAPILILPSDPTAAAPSAAGVAPLVTCGVFIVDAPQNLTLFQEYKILVGVFSLVGLPVPGATVVLQRHPALEAAVSFFLADSPPPRDTTPPSAVSRVTGSDGIATFDRFVIGGGVSSLLVILATSGVCRSDVYQGFFVNPIEKVSLVSLRVPASGFESAGDESNFVTLLYTYEEGQNMVLTAKVTGPGGGPVPGIAGLTGRAFVAYRPPWVESDISRGGRAYSTFFDATSVPISGSVSRPATADGVMVWDSLRFAPGTPGLWLIGFRIAGIPGPGLFFFPVMSAVRAIEVVRAPQAGTIRSGFPFAVQPAVRVLGAGGVPLEGVRVWCMVNRTADISPEQAYVTTLGAPSALDGNLLTALSRPSDAAGLATFGSLGFIGAEPRSEGYTLIFGVGSGDSSDAPSYNPAIASVPGSLLPVPTSEALVLTLVSPGSDSVSSGGLMAVPISVALQGAVDRVPRPGVAAWIYVVHATDPSIVPVLEGNFAFSQVGLATFSDFRVHAPAGAYFFQVIVPGAKTAPKPLRISGTAFVVSVATRPPSVVAIGAQFEAEVRVLVSSASALVQATVSATLVPWEEESGDTGSKSKSTTTTTTTTTSTSSSSSSVDLSQALDASTSSAVTGRDGLALFKLRVVAAPSGDYGLVFKSGIVSSSAVRVQVVNLCSALVIEVQPGAAKGLKEHTVGLAATLRQPVVIARGADGAGLADMRVTVRLVQGGPESQESAGAVIFDGPGLTGSDGRLAFRGLRVVAASRGTGYRLIFAVDGQRSAASDPFAISNPAEPDTSRLSNWQYIAFAVVLGILPILTGMSAGLSRHVAWVAVVVSAGYVVACIYLLSPEILPGFEGVADPIVLAMRAALVVSSLSALAGCVVAALVLLRRPGRSHERVYFAQCVKHVHRLCSGMPALLRDPQARGVLVKLKRESEVRAAWEKRDMERRLGASVGQRIVFLLKRALFLERKPPAPRPARVLLDSSFFFPQNWLIAHSLSLVIIFFVALGCIVLVRSVALGVLYAQDGVLDGQEALTSRAPAALEAAEITASTAQIAADLASAAARLPGAGPDTEVGVLLVRLRASADSAKGAVEALAGQATSAVDGGDVLARFRSALSGLGSDLRSDEALSFLERVGDCAAVTGGVAVALAVLALLVVQVLMALRFRQVTTDLRQGKSYYPRRFRKNFTLVNASSYVGIQAWHFALSLLLLFLLLWVVLFCLSFGPLRRRIWDFVRPFLIALLSLSFVANLVIPLVANTVALQDVFVLRIPLFFAALDFFRLFFGIVAGLGSALVRLSAVVIGVFVFYPRLDYPLAPPHPYEGQDAGFAAYYSMVLSCHYYQNPVFLVFASLLRPGLARQTMGPELQERFQPARQPSSVRARNRWFLAYTLVRNPILAKSAKESIARSIDDVPDLIDDEAGDSVSITLSEAGMGHYSYEQQEDEFEEGKRGRKMMYKELYEVPGYSYSEGDGYSSA
jgi:hypothetical protein